MLADKPTELSRIKLKTWTRPPVPMVSQHSAYLTPLSVDFRTWLWRYTYLLLSISMLWHRQAIFKSKRDKLCSSAECRIWTRNPRHQIGSRLNARWQTDWANEDQAKNLNSTARPYDQRAFTCQLSSTYASRHWNRAKKRNSNDVPVAALDNWHPVWNAHGVNFNTCVC